MFTKTFNYIFDTSPRRLARWMQLSMVPKLESKFCVSKVKTSVFYSHSFISMIFMIFSYSL